MQKFHGNFTQQEPLSEDAITSAVEVMRSGRLHRYNTVDDQPSETSLLESEFADYMDMRYCLACASGGYAMQVALKACGLERDDPVLTNAFTLSPVPGAIHNAGGTPVLVETTENLTIDLDDLQLKITQSGARYLLLSHMRGNIVDMNQLVALLEKHNVTLIEDCAHTMGASWQQKKSGSFGKAACFSTQTYKHINSGEGGLLVTNDAQTMASATVMSGSYMLYQRHGAVPAEEFFASAKFETPNCSGRMDNLRAAILRPQLTALDENCQRWNRLYRALATELKKNSYIVLPNRPTDEHFVASSLQFLLPGISQIKALELVKTAKQYNVELKWFGSDEPTGFTSNHTSWRYMPGQSLPATDKILSGLFDLRLPLTFTTDDCDVLGQIINYCVNEISTD